MRFITIFETFGDTLNERLDLEELTSFVNGIDGIEASISVPLLTRRVFTDILKKEQNKNEEITGVVVASGSRSRFEEKLRMEMEKLELDPNLLTTVNIREQCALVHDDRDSATSKAKRLLRVGLERAKLATPLDRSPIQRFNEVLVIGGGVSGIHASLDLAQQDILVHLVEREPTIGGMMPLLGRTFPEDSCAICIGGPKMADVQNEPNIKLHDYTEIESVTKLPVGYRVKIRNKPRYVDYAACVTCGQCSDVCPVEVSDKLEGYMADRKAIYMPYSQAIPRVYIIDEDNCLYKTKGSCRLCERVCPNDAIDFDEMDTFEDLYVGAIIVATGFENFDPSPYPRFGSEHPEVIDQYQLARLLDGEGPTAGELMHPTTEGKPERIIMIQCAGSRDPEFNPYCSRYCCMAAIKHAEEIKLHQGTDIDVSILYKDIRAGGKFYEELYNRVKELDVNFIHGEFDKVVKTGEGELVVQYEDGRGQRQALTGDLVVLSTGMVPSEGSRDLASKLGIELDRFGFYAEVDPKVGSVITKKPGVFLAGACHSPKDIPESVAQANAAAAMTSLHLMKEVNAVKPDLAPIVDEDACGRCGICISLCPYDALSLPPEGAVKVDKDLCQACGLCISSCPTRALDNPNYGFDLLEEEVKGALEDAAPDQLNIIGFACNDCGYNLLDTAGVYNARYSSSFTPIYVPCMSSVSVRHIITTLDMGADGVMLIGCVEDRCHYETGVDHAESQLRLMKNLYGSLGRKMPVRVIKSCGTMLRQFLETLDDFESSLKEDAI
ncbi:MAG: hydrogenase iron-sulfur subunit [Candidatus Bathyarchaeia archaeon]